MKKIVLLVSLIINGLLAQDCSYIDDLMPKSYKTKDLDCLMLIAQRDYDKLIPLKIDDITTLNKVSYNKNSKAFISTYTMYSNSGNVSQEDWENTHNYISKYIIKENCNTPNLRIFFKCGLTNKHIYQDKTNNTRFIILVNDEVCKKL